MRARRRYSRGEQAIRKREGAAKGEQALPLVAFDTTKGRIEIEPAPLEGPSDLQPLAQVLILRPESFGSRDPAAVFGDAQTRARIPIYVWGLDSV